MSATPKKRPPKPTTDFMFALDADTAVAPFIMGAPEKVSQIEPFLYELFRDPLVIRMPLGFLYQTPLARYIAKKRAPKVAPRYQALGGSPLAANTRRQCAALQRILGVEVAHVFRYMSPTADEVLAELKAKGFRRVVALSLYPQASLSTTATSLAEFRAATARHGLELIEVERYPEHPLFIRSLVERWKQTVNVPDVELERAHVLFTAHGVPLSLVRAGDDYPAQIEATMRAVVAAAPEITRYSLAYQSRVGPAQWTGPYLDDELLRLGREGVETLVLFPLSFTAEHLETIYDLDIVATEQALSAGVKMVLRVPAPGDHPVFIEALAALAVAAAGESGDEQGAR